MKIEAVDFFHLGADGRPEAVLARVAGGGAVGRGAAFAASALAGDANGETLARDAPGLVIEIDAGGVRNSGIAAEIKVRGETLYRAPSAATPA